MHMRWIAYKVSIESQKSDVNLDHRGGFRSSSVVVEFQDSASFLAQGLVFIIHSGNFAAAIESGW